MATTTEGRTRTHAGSPLEAGQSEGVIEDFRKRRRKDVHESFRIEPVPFGRNDDDSGATLTFVSAQPVSGHHPTYARFRRYSYPICVLCG